VIHVYGPPRVDPRFGDCLVHATFTPKGAPPSECHLLAHRSVLAGAPLFARLFEGEAHRELIDERESAPRARPWHALPLCIHAPLKRPSHGAMPGNDMPASVTHLPDYYAVYHLAVPFCPSILVKVVAALYGVGHTERAASIDPFADPPTNALNGARPNESDKHQHRQGEKDQGKEHRKEEEEEEEQDDGEEEDDALADRLDRKPVAERDMLDDLCALERANDAVAIAEARAFLGLSHKCAYGGPVRTALASALEMRAMSLAIAPTLDRVAAARHSLGETNRGTRAGRSLCSMALTERGPLGALVERLVASTFVTDKIKRAILQRCWHTLDAREQAAVTSRIPALVELIRNGALVCYSRGVHPHGGDMEPTVAAPIDHDMVIADMNAASPPPSRPPSPLVAQQGGHTERARPLFAVGFDTVQERTDRVLCRGTNHMLPTEVQACGFLWRMVRYRQCISLFSDRAHKGASGERDQSAQRLFARVTGWVYHPFLGRLPMTAFHYEMPRQARERPERHHRHDDARERYVCQAKRDRERVDAHRVFAFPGAPLMYAPGGDPVPLPIVCEIDHELVGDARLLAFAIELEPRPDPLAASP